MVKDLECAACHANVGEVFKADRTKGRLRWLWQNDRGVLFVHVFCDAACEAKSSPPGGVHVHGRAFAEIAGDAGVERRKDLLSDYTWAGREQDVREVFERLGALPNPD